MKNLATQPHKFKYIAILKTLERYRFLTLNQFVALLNARAFSQVRKMVFQLWKHNYLERLILTRATKKLSIYYVFALSRLGARQLTVMLNKEKIFYLKSNDKRSSLFLEHTLLINNFRICLELLSQKNNGARLIFWTHAKQDLRIRINAY
jgi:hypothetical protein